MTRRRHHPGEEEEEEDGAFHTPPQTPSRGNNNNEPVPWRQAHLETCLAQGTLAVSLGQVVRQGGFANLSDHPQDGEPDVLLWGETTSGRNFERVLQEYQQQQQREEQQPEMTTPNPKKEIKASTVNTLFSAASTATSVVMTPFRLLTSPFAPPKGDYDDDIVVDDNDDSDEDVPRPEQFDQNNNHHTTTSPSNSHVVWVDQEEVLLNLPLTVECLEYLQTAIQTSPPLILTMAATKTANKNGSNTTISSSIYTWVQSVSHDNPDARVAQILANLPTSQVSFLMNVLAACGHVEKVQRHKSGAQQQDSLLYLLPDPSSSTDVRLSLWDLDNAYHNLERRLHRLEVEATQARATARQLRDDGQRQAALYQLARHKRLGAELERGHQQLQNLDQVKLALEGAEGTYAMQQTMMETARTLKQIREHGNHVAGNDDDKSQQGESLNLDDLAEQVGYLHDDHADLMVADIVVSDVDEEELAKELEQLMQQDEQEERATKRATAASATAKLHQLTTTRPTKAAPPKKEKDDDVDELLAELDLLQVGSPKNKASITQQQPAKTATAQNKGPTMIAASVFGEQETVDDQDKDTTTISKKTANDKKPSSPRRLFGLGGSNRQSSRNHKDKAKKTQLEEPPKEKEERRQLAVCL